MNFLGTNTINWTTAQWFSMALSFYVMGIRSLAQLLSSGPRCLLSMMGAKIINVQYSNTVSAWRACIYMHISNTMPKGAHTMHELNYTVYTYTYFYVCIKTHRTHPWCVYNSIYILQLMMYMYVYIYIHVYIYMSPILEETRLSDSSPEMPVIGRWSITDLRRHSLPKTVAAHHQ